MSVINFMLFLPRLRNLLCQLTNWQLIFGALLLRRSEAQQLIRFNELTGIEALHVHIATMQQRQT